MRAAGFVSLVIALSTPGTAHAGRTFYGWLYGTEVLPERGVELQTWIAEENRAAPTHEKETSLWWGPLVGVTDQLEVAFPIEMRWQVEDGEQPSFTIHRFGAEARYRFVSQDPVNKPAFAPLGRIAVKRDVTVRESIRLEADLVASYEAGPFHALIDIGAVGQLGKDTPNQFSLYPGVGLSIAIAGDLRLGAEGYGEVALDSTSDEWYAVGPNMAWTHGRFWLSAAMGIGVYKIHTAPRVVWGVLF